LRNLAETLQHLLQSLALFALLATAVIQGRKNIFPQAGAIGYRRTQRLACPTQQAEELAQMAEPQRQQQQQGHCKAEGEVKKESEPENNNAQAQYYEQNS
jgi:hypothetical protein